MPEKNTTSNKEIKRLFVHSYQLEKKLIALNLFRPNFSRTFQEINFFQVIFFHKRIIYSYSE